MNTKKIFPVALIALGGLFLTTVSFWAGMHVGMFRENFGHRWEENYPKNFNAPGMPFLPGMHEGMSAHGTAGVILKVDASSIVIQGSDHLEKVISVNNDTVVRAGFDAMTFSYLKTGQRVLIVGSPSSSGQIEAQFIRVFP